MAMHLSSALGDEGEWRGRECPVDTAASIIGSRATLLVIREAFYGTTRFDDFVTHTRLTTAVVSSRLKTLVEHHVLERRPYRDAGKRAHREYLLTARGEALLPLVLALMQWGSDQAPDGGPVRANDSASGARVVVEPRGGDDRPLDADRIVIEPAPAWTSGPDRV
ncbi:winged helix-turn-helix transcriptional regulator [Herbiconiux daphne]|uniref:Helix-turn-helix transcriptional regulator n=1 Tax=Herbiconiux daphne TaxID=2970914 RepID=A0ABT2H5F8_9MICO|nr:helix-turn-helix domain-containing protein [Herbiconiux daphne]MCS5735123.1 helix-turn-helix transcriptional regulator [Herbiconiux daphne]